MNLSVLLTFIASTLVFVGYIPYIIDTVKGETRPHAYSWLIGSLVTAISLAGQIYGKAGITVNKNTVPFEPRSPFDPSGIRLGTSALTTRGMKEKEMKQVAEWIDEAVTNHTSDSKLSRIHTDIKKFAAKFPLPK